MFKLQRLEITGFKSFADYTEIVFTGNGITAVVGPNGCGKSNVSDAISWVLGEQRAKSLRGSEMKDVVFQGTKNRKPSGMAEVVLHMIRDEDVFDIEENELEDIDETLSELDENAVIIEDLEGSETAEALIGPVVGETNGFHPEEFETETVQAAQVGSIQTVHTKVRTKRHWRPRSFALDFAPGEAVSVTRRLYLSGESEYQLNGKTCRLRDIQDLFAGTGLSGAHYAIIEQGRIGQILSAKPADRRNLIEEAAGISKFRTRQRAAETRLETAKTNLGRVSDIVSEIEKQANSLRRQAGKTRRYKILQEEFRVLLRQLFAAEGRHFSNLSEELVGQLAEAEKIEAEITAKVASREEAFRTATLDARAKEESLAELRRQHAQNALERDRAEREHRYISEQVVNLNNRSEALRGEIESTEQRLGLIESEFQKLEADDQAEHLAAAEAETALREAETLQKTKLDELNAIDKELETARADLVQHTAAVERFDEIKLQLESNLAKLAERAEGLKREGVRAEETCADLKKEAALLAENLKAENEKLSQLQGEKKNILMLTAEARDFLRAAEERLQSVRDEFSRKKNRLDTLIELEEKRAVYSPQVQKLFAEQEKIGVRLAGVLADRLSVDERAERAVESLFGTYLQAVLVESEADARKISAWIKANDIGRTAVLVVPLPASHGARTTSQPATIGDLIGVYGELAEILRRIFPREMAARLVDRFEEVETGNDEILIDLDGDVLIGGSLFISGKIAVNEKNASLLAFKRELSQLERDTGNLSGEIEKADRVVAESRKALEEKEETTVDLQSLIIKVERGVHGLEIQERTARQEIERSERHRAVVAGETEQIAAEILEIQNRQEQSTINSQAAVEQRAKAEKDMAEIAERLGNVRSELEIENAHVNEKRMLAATSAERRRAAQSALRRVENEQKELESRLALQNLEISEAEAKTKNLRASILEITDKIASADDDIKREETELAEALDILAKARSVADALSEELAELNKSAAEARNDRAEIEIGQAEAITNLRNISEKCVQELNVPLPELVESEETGDDFDLKEARERADDLRQRLESFGAINMLALEELGETEERLLFLTSQRQDIIDSIASAEEALREIKVRSRERFKRAFDAINVNFMEYFQELFGGGRGEMTLLESDDILEAGIEVVAQPPGKRLQNILLLSGGEKAMTAIALVLAIFKYQPSPFCLLDEVDAPLDDANVGRFVGKIAEMSEKTQFIVITHNKRTMEAARALYGVTMQEAGVSKVVSVKFE